MPRTGALTALALAIVASAGMVRATPEWYQVDSRPDTLRALDDLKTDDAVSICQRKLVGKDRAAVLAYLGPSDLDHGDTEYTYHQERHNGSLWMMEVEFADDRVVEIYGQDIGDLSFKVHGRLSIYCGNPGCRIWVVGTKRILGIGESLPPGISLMPRQLSKILTPNTELFGDFTVVPLSPERDGQMQIVRIFAAERLVQADLNGRYLRRIPGKLQAE